MSPPVDMGDSSYYALTADAKQLAAVVIAGAGAGVLTGLSTYELALANAKQERSALLAKARNWDKETSDSGTGAGAGALNAKSLTLPSGSSAGQRGNMVNSDSPTTTDDSPFSIERKGACESDGDTVTCTDMMMPSATQRDGDRADRNQSDGHDVDEEETKRIAEEREAEKEAEAEKKREQERENESPLEDMSRDELKERILPFLAGDLFLIWRETDLATEKEKLRVRNRLLHIEEDTNGVSEEVMEERRRIDAMSFDERAEYEKDKREEVVYTMLQVKYGLDEEKITDDAERLRNHSKGTNT